MVHGESCVVTALPGVKEKKVLHSLKMSRSWNIRGW
jgi:hypothetical protein